MDGRWPVNLVTSAVFCIAVFAPQYACAAGTTPGAPTLSCYVCHSGIKFINFNCIGSSTINADRTAKVTCGGRCVTRTSSIHHESAVFRGCSDQFALPTPYPADGCYQYTKDTVCICSKSGCNNAALGKSKGKKYMKHVKKSQAKAGKSYEWDDVVPREGDIVRCHECNSGSQDKPNANCRGDDVINSATSFKSNCSEKCFARTMYLNPGVVYRGCTKVFPSLPRPLPADGCYKFYGETWCICDYSLCNDRPLGMHTGVELDDHLREGPTGAVFACYTTHYWAVLLSTVVIMYRASFVYN